MMRPMERAARRLLLFSLVSLLAVLVLGMLRGAGPIRAWLADPDRARTAALFHSHFDQLCWLGAAAAGAVLWILRDGYRGPAWAPRVFSFAYAAGALLFSAAFALKLVAQAVGSGALARGGFAALVSLGGALLAAAVASGAVLVRGLEAGPAAEVRAGDAGPREPRSLV